LTRPAELPSHLEDDLARFGSMLDTVAVTPGERVETADQRLLMYGVPWSHVDVQLALRGDAPVPRMAYLDGTLELVRPSKDHERIKSYLGRLVEAYALERHIDLSPFGSWTLKHAPAAAGLEPDECFILGPDQVKPIPDLAIEVIWTSGGIDKLEIYRRLDGDRFERVERSRLFPGLDLDLLVSLLDRPTALQAIRALRPALAG
jgi:hypothetical protein